MTKIKSIPHRHVCANRRFGWSAARSALVLLLAFSVRASRAGLFGHTELSVQRTNDTSSSVHLKLSLAHEQSVAGERADVQVKIVNASNRPLELFDPSLNPLLRTSRAVTLRILTSEGVELASAAAPSLGSCRLPLPSDWVVVPPGGEISTTITFTSGTVFNEATGQRTKLAPGKYLLELGAQPPFLSGIPRFMKGPQFPELDQMLNLPDYRAWKSTFRDLPVLRSNRVELEILPRTGN